MIQVSSLTIANTPTIHVPPSKSEAARWLILKAQNDDIQLLNVPEANDTRVLSKALTSSHLHYIDMEDAGTAMRFGTAFFVLSGWKGIIGGSVRMYQRPIGALVDALRLLGASIEYVDKLGYPPLRLMGFMDTSISNLVVDSSVSSQFTSALLLALPMLGRDFTLHFTGGMASMSYTDLTIGTLRQAGIEIERNGPIISLKHGQPKTGVYHIHADWSAASYAYSICGLSGRSIYLPGLAFVEEYGQGDQAIATIMGQIGIDTVVEKDCILLKPAQITKSEIEIDFSQIPDLAQTVVIYCAAKGVKLVATGLASLRIKETDRIAALVMELAKVGIDVRVDGDAISLEGKIKPLADGDFFCTHNDHRMAMSLAPLTALFPIRFDYPDVVKKSWPGFWEALAGAGIDITDVA